MAVNKHIGSSLDDFLKEDGLYDELTANAAKEVFAWKLKKQMEFAGLTKVAMAKRMDTSRSQVDRLLDPSDGNITLETMQKAAFAVGKPLSIDFAKPAAVAVSRTFRQNKFTVAKAAKKKAKKMVARKAAAKRVKRTIRTTADRGRGLAFSAKAKR